MNNAYQILKERMLDKSGFPKQAALRRIEELKNELTVLTDDQVNELTELANKYGSDNNMTVEQRLLALEAKCLELETRDMEHDAAIAEIGVMLMEGMDMPMDDEEEADA